MAETLCHFTDKVLSKDIFTCDSCKNRLTIPIRLVNDIGSVCKKCYEDNEWTGLRNVGLELILQELKIPCKFRQTGCKERISYEQLEHHEKMCKYHEKSCLMDSSVCQWKGVQSVFPTHFKESHPDDVLVEPSGIFHIDIHTTKLTTLIKMLVCKHEFIIQISKENDDLIYTICDVKASTSGVCVISHMGQNSNKLETKCNISTLSDRESLRLNLHLLRQLIGVGNCLQIKITMHNSAITEFDENVMQYFECPVCKTLMKPPIYQCKFGHSFCSNCKPKLEKCPNCRAQFGATRNYSLEGLTSIITYSCMYQNLGCNETLAVNELNKHEAVCLFKPYPCPVEECYFKGTHTNIAKHLNEQHKDRVIAANYFQTAVEFRLESMLDIYNYQQKFFMIFDDNVFRLSFKRNSDYSFWAVEVLRKNDEDSVFIYDIGIIDMRKPDRRLIRCDLCFNDTNSDELLKKCILFPNNILASYSYNGMFTYYCQIRNRKNSDLNPTMA